jgi:hypothetical protein
MNTDYATATIPTLAGKFYARADRLAGRRDHAADQPNIAETGFVVQGFISRSSGWYKRDRFVARKHVDANGLAVCIPRV